MARGLQSLKRMPFRLILALALFAGASVRTSAVGAQDPAVDLIVSINGDAGFESDAAGRYFNRVDCGLENGPNGTGGAGGGAGGTGGAGGFGGMGGTGGMAGALGVGGASGMGGFGGAGGFGGFGGAGGIGGATDVPVMGSPETTTFDIRLQNTGASIGQVFLWVGGENANCQQVENRNETLGVCAEIAGNPRPVGNNFTVRDVVLQELLDAQSGNTQIVSCETSGLTGTPYEIFAFRGEAPGANNVDPANYGITSFFVDVQAPAQPQVDTTPQFQSNFNITWDDPDPPDDIQRWAFFCNAEDDPENATMLSFTAETGARSQTIAATTLEGLGCLTPGAGGDSSSGFVYVTAFDQAFVSNELGGNESDFSSAVEVNFVEVAGACASPTNPNGIPCDGCSARRFQIAAGAFGPVTWMLALLFGFVVVWRLRR